MTDWNPATSDWQFQQRCLKCGLKLFPYDSQEAEDWANKQMVNKTSNYVIFDENLINILAKYGIVGGVGITALQNSDI